MPTKSNTQLTREIRFSLPPPDDGSWNTPRINSWAGWPNSGSLVPHLVLRMKVEGQVDLETGLLCNVKRLDEVFWETISPRMRRLQANNTKPLTAELMLLECVGTSPTKEKLEVAANELKLRWIAFELVVTPYYRVEWKVIEQRMYVTQQFEFSASHRLHSEHLSAEDNEQLFGKCNRPNGHGHNYVVDVTVEYQTNATDRDELPLAIDINQQVAETVRSEVIEPFDHRHLNLDIPEFSSLNPSVENIAAVIFQRLAAVISTPRLHSVRVYETPKTWAECIAQ